MDQNTAGCKLYCTSSSCNLTSGDDNTLKCVKCKQKWHFQCTKHPIYQIYLFQTKGYRSFKCEQCVNVPVDFKESLTMQKENVIVKYKRDIIGCENIIKSQKQTEKELRYIIKDLTQERTMKDQITEVIEMKFKDLESVIKTTTIKDNVRQRKTFAETVSNKRDSNERGSEKVKRINKDQKNIGEEIRVILKEERSKQVAEDYQKKIRSKNLIFRGV